METKTIATGAGILVGTMLAAGGFVLMGWFGFLVGITGGVIAWWAIVSAGE